MLAFLWVVLLSLLAFSIWLAIRYWVVSLLLVVVGVVVHSINKDRQRIQEAAAALKRKEELEKENQRKREDEERNRKLYSELARQREQQAILVRERLKKAQAAGHDVCYRCETVDPKYCSRCGQCMECNGGEYYPDLCYNCDDGGD